MLESVAPQDSAGTREKLVDLLDYVETVVRLDERVAYDLADYVLGDGKPARFRPEDTRALPGVRHDVADDQGPVWLAVERLNRSDPPAVPEAIVDWLTVSRDPSRAPEVLRERHVTVDEAGRLARIAAGACADAFVPVDDPDPDATPHHRLKLCLADQPSTEAQVHAWISDDWAAWSETETPRRRTIALYERLYRLLQQLEIGGADAPIEVVWGVGVVRWHHAGRRVERPLIERSVDLELDDQAGGLLRVRPTVADATVDLKPYEDLGCANLPLLEDLARREIDRASADEGVSPFRRASFEPILAAAAARLHPGGRYVPEDAAGPETEEPAPDGVLTIDDRWVLFARPRSAHVVLADIERLRGVARDPERSIEGLPTRIVTEPSAAAAEAWEPLSPTLGGSPALDVDDEPVTIATEVFFPKPFNDDQIEIVRRLAKSDGLVVQGPPGTGKTHTIANLICHAMATGQRVLVVSRGEAALAVLRDQLPEKVRPLAIAILSNERQGLRQVEGAIREIQTIVEGSRPDIRHAAIRRCEAEIVKLRQRIAAIDVELDAIAAEQVARMGPRDEMPADVARRLAAERGAHAWFTDSPTLYLAETPLTDTDLRDLGEARRRVGDLIDHCGATLPAPDDLPAPDEVAGWHEMLLQGATLAQVSADGPARGLRVGVDHRVVAETLADALDRLAHALDGLAGDAWLRPLLLRQGTRSPGPWAALLQQLCAEWLALDSARAESVGQGVELPPGLLHDPDARAAIARAASGERLWPLLAVGKAAAKALVGAIRLRGAPVQDGDTAGWRSVLERVRLVDRARDLEARWHSFGVEAGAQLPLRSGDLPIAAAATLSLEAARQAFAHLPGLPATVPPFDGIAGDPVQARALAAQLRQVVEAGRLHAVRSAAGRTDALFAHGQDRTSIMARRFLAEVLGQAHIDVGRIGPTWRALLARLQVLRDRAEDFATIGHVTDVIAQSGAPLWAERLRREPAPSDHDPLIPATWRDAWDFAAADAHLARIDARQTLASLSNQRAEHERNCTRLFVELVRERTFYTLERRLSPAVKSALVEFIRALARLGKGTGKGAGKQRRAARDAMLRCYGAVPCWIMPTWRVAEQIPSELAAFDLVILDEASQSDVTELPAVLRGKKILVVGDDRQVSPMAPFVSQAKIDQLRRRHLRGLPFQSLLEPGESLYTLMQAVFPDERLMLKEHFRCVEPIIRFSMQFYPETLLPLRIPSAAERIDPPLVDIFVPHGLREKGRKINPAEADVIVEEVAALAAVPAMAHRTIGVISLIGGDQAELIRGMLSDRLGAEIMQRHAVLCGDSATFQGNERDIVFLSMVADKGRRTTLTMRRYEQRFNVAMSRARDRVVLVRSVERQDLSPADLKARLLAHFEDPMPLNAKAHAGDPDADKLARCDSAFERDVMGRLLALNYQVEPQVGALGFRIDMVVEGAGGRRLAVECDGDSFHGPEHWREDMRRQRILERVGWRFWRCFASSFYRDPDGTIEDLVGTLARFGIEPSPEGRPPAGPSPFVEHRVAPAPAQGGEPAAPEPAASEKAAGTTPPGAEPNKTAGPHDRLVLSFADGRRPLSVVLTEGAGDLDQGLVALDSPLGQSLAGREEDDEVDLPMDGATRKALVERIERGGSSGGVTAPIRLPASPSASAPAP